MAIIPYSARQFSLPEVPGISPKTFETHIKLYEGYVKHTNFLLELMEKQIETGETEVYGFSTVQRRFSFEFDGMRNHEYYFGALEDGPKQLLTDSLLAKAINDGFGSFDRMIARLKLIASTRGIGWAMLYYDPTAKRLLTQWVDEQHLGHLTGLSPIVALDMWEHSYLLDYAPADKAKYAEAYLNAINWETINRWYEESMK